MDEDDGNVSDDRPHPEWVSTGSLPSDEEVQTFVTAGYERFRDLDEGTVADYIPALAKASPEFKEALKRLKITDLRELSLKKHRKSSTASNRMDVLEVHEIL